MLPEAARESLCREPWGRHSRPRGQRRAKGARAAKARVTPRCRVARVEPEPGGGGEEAGGSG